jgi:hypothetical protein
MSDDAEQEQWARQFVNQLLGTSVPKYPQGKLNDDDAGEAMMALAVDVKARTVVIHYPKPILWIGLGKQEALNLAAKLTELANELP